jgi:hypothetical protein
MISSMTPPRPQQRYDHRLRQLVQRTGDLTIATDLGVPRSTARGWLRTAPPVVVSLDVADLTELELRQEVLKLRQRLQKLAALLRLALIMLRISGFTLAGERLPDGPDKLRILRAIDQARACIRAASTDILHFCARVVVPACRSSHSVDAPILLGDVERRRPKSR